VETNEISTAAKEGRASSRMGVKKQGRLEMRMGGYRGKGGFSGESNYDENELQKNKLKGSRESQGTLE